MLFRNAAPDENFTAGHLVSENGRWEMGYRQMLFGVRVSAALVGDAGCTLDYCAGAQPTTQRLLYRMVRLILEGLPEDTTQAELRAMLPTYERRPIDRDPACWNRLIEMAARSPKLTVPQESHAQD